MKQEYVEILARGENVSFRPRGNSMSPKIKSGQKVTISPDISDIEIGDAVFCKVKGNFYVHLVKGIDGEHFLIGNNRGNINGWTMQVFGKVVSIEE